MSAGDASVAVVIVNYRTPDLAIRCVQSLEAERRRVGSLEVVVVDGGSGDGSAEKLEAGLRGLVEQGWVTLLPLEINGGFGWANNQAMLRLLQRAEPPDYIHLLNPDTVIRPGAVAALIEALAEKPRIGAAGSQLFEADGRLSGSAFRFPTVPRELVRGANTPGLERMLGIPPGLVDYGRRHEAEWVTGASVMLRAEALREAGLFDSGFFLYFEDVELMHRLTRSGWEVVHVPESEVVHIGGASTGIQDEGGAPRRLPPYWHRARRRYLTLAQGRAGAVAINLAWLVGRGILTIRRLTRLARGKSVAPHEARDMIRHGFWPIRSDKVPAVTHWQSEPGLPPTWMSDDWG